MQVSLHITDTSLVKGELKQIGPENEKKNVFSPAYFICLSYNNNFKEALFALNLNSSHVSLLFTNEGQKKVGL